MAYPKPLAEKSLARLYQQSGISQEQSDYLHSLFLACANLYGAVQLRVIWDVYQAQKDAPKLRRKDLIAFSAIVRRETQPYYVFEIDELYSEEKRADLSREVVSAQLIGFGYGRLNSYYSLIESIGREPYFVPDDVLQYATQQPTKEELNLLDFLNELKVTAKECRPKYGNPYPCENRGKRLREFSFLNSHERFEEEYLTKNHGALQNFRERVAGSEAEKVLRQYWRSENISPLRFGSQIESVTEELAEVGVELSDSQVEKLVQLLTDYHNNSHLWCLSGWAPSELMRQSGSSMPKSISFGPNMQKMFASGEMNKDELVREMKRLGIEVVD